MTGLVHNTFLGVSIHSLQDARLLRIRFAKADLDWTKLCIHHDAYIDPPTELVCVRTSTVS